MLAAGPSYAMCEQVASGRVGNPVIGVIEQFKIESRIGQHLSRIYPQAPEYRWKGRYGADAHSSF